ncbi:hypothetical protein LXA43DRAFT_1007969 [Ganoderma leucocontextum]|nr:hypothetical protein LXA43DRAFT_1007969 [Ganoderma leucocontextum]
MVWPKGFSATFPWPDLEFFRVSHPHPADEIYAHLPSSLRRLALRPWPHRCLRIFPDIHMPLYPDPLDGRGSASIHRYVAPARDLTQFVRKYYCDLPLLRSLELEYASDAEEPELLWLAVVKFPHLTALEIHRFQSEGSDGVRATELAHALAPLASLRTLKLYLDFVDISQPGVDGDPDHGPQLRRLVSAGTQAPGRCRGRTRSRLGSVFAGDLDVRTWLDVVHLPGVARRP